MEKFLSKSLFQYDEKLRKTKTLCGIDEVGRGPLAGDVYAAAVVFDADAYIEGINDSKKLSVSKREYLYDKILESAKCSIGVASVAEIDEMNILNATLLAMKRAYLGLNMNIDLVLVDGNIPPPLPNTAVETIIHGDTISASIAAASIIAKVSRDRYMVELDKQFPEYGFAQHKGYGTQLHRNMISQHGLCPIHRRTFTKRFVSYE